jgi:hypothetical protein
LGLAELLFQLTFPLLEFLLTILQLLPAIFELLLDLLFQLLRTLTLVLLVFLVTLRLFLFTLGATLGQLFQVFTNVLLRKIFVEFEMPRHPCSVHPVRNDRIEILTVDRDPPVGNYNFAEAAPVTDYSPQRCSTQFRVRIVSSDTHEKISRWFRSDPAQIAQTGLFDAPFVRSFVN